MPIRFCAGFFIALLALSARAADPVPLKVGEKAPEFEITDPTGKTTYTVAGLLKDKKAAVVCVWCAQCLGCNDVPAMNDFGGRIKGLPVSFLAIEAYETADELKALSRDKKIDFPLGCAKASEPYRTVLGPKGYKCFTTFVIAPDGKVAWVGGHFGLDYNDKMKEETLKRHLAGLDVALKKLGVDVPSGK
jgi:peroxiredoxin